MTGSYKSEIFNREVLMAVSTKIYKILCEYRFKPIILFYDMKNQIGDILFKDYKHWTHDGMRINLNNFENRSALAIDHNRLALEFDMPDSLVDFRSKFERALKEYTKRVKIETYIRLGLRIQSMIPVEFKFNELVKITHKKFFSQDKKLEDVVGTRVEDYQYNIVSERDSYKLHTICGPVTKEEMPRWFTPANLVVNPGEEPKEIKYPDVAFFIDCDFYITNPSDGVSEGFLEKAVHMVTSTTNGISEYLFGGR